MVLAFVLLGLATPTLAGPVVVVRADFDADLPGGPPDPSLPGEPAGDSLTLTAAPAGSGFEVVEQVGPLHSRPLYAQRSAEAAELRCGFNLPEADRTCRTLVIEWCSVALTPIPPTAFVLRGPQGAVHGSINYRHGAITINRAFGVNHEAVAGAFEVGTAQCFRWHVDRSSGRQSLTIDGVVAVEGLETVWHGVSAIDVWSFRYEPSTPGSFAFAIDDVTIGADDCATPVAASSWGQLKSRYRTIPVDSPQPPH